MEKVLNVLYAQGYMYGKNVHLATETLFGVTSCEHATEPLSSRLPWIMLASIICLCSLGTMEHLSTVDQIGRRDPHPGLTVGHVGYAICRNEAARHLTWYIP